MYQRSSGKWERDLTKVKKLVIDCLKPIYQEKAVKFGLRVLKKHRNGSKLVKLTNSYGWKFAACLFELIPDYDKQAH